MWEIDIKLQLLGFLRSVGLGAFFCLFYDFFRAIRRRTASTTIEVLFEDIVYFLLCTPIVFCFLLATTNGELRAFVFLGIVLGFLLFRFVFSKFTIKILDFLFTYITKAFVFLNSITKVFYDLICRVFDKIGHICCKIFEKATKVTKKLLKKK